MAGASQDPGILPAFARETTRQAPAYGRAASRADTRRTPLHPALPAELEFLVRESAEMKRRFMSALEAAPLDVPPLDTILNEGLIAEEAYYRALASRLGCAYYSGKPPLAPACDPKKSILSGLAPLAAEGAAPRAVFAPRGAWVSGLIEMTAGGRLDPAGFAVAAPRRLQALIRMSRAQTVLAEALGRLPEVLSARRRMSAGQAATAGLIAAAAIALAATHGAALSGGLIAGLWLLFLAAILLRSMAAVAEGVAVRPPALSDDELPAYTVIAALYREADVVPRLVKALDALDYPALWSNLP